MVANEKTYFFHLLKKLWRWGALICLVNLMHYGVAMGQCIQPPTVTKITNTSPAGTVQLKRVNATLFTIYKAEVEIDTTNCQTSNEIRMNIGTIGASLGTGILTLTNQDSGKNFPLCAQFNTLSNLLSSCQNNIGNTISGISGLNTTVTIDVNSQCTSKTGSITRPFFLSDSFSFISSCKKYRLAIEVSRNNTNMTLRSGSDSVCNSNIFIPTGNLNCITSGTINYSNFAIKNSANVKLFDLSSFSSVLPPVSIKYSDSPPTCAVTLPPLVVMPKMTPDKVTATTAGQAIPGTTIDLPITLNCQNADNQAKVFTWTFATPSADGFSILNDPTLNIKGGVSSAGISAQIFSTIDLTGRDKVKFTENPTLVKNSRSYIATPTSNTTIVPHKVRLIRNSETTQEGTFISKATFTVEYQ